MSENNDTKFGTLTDKTIRWGEKIFNYKYNYALEKEGKDHEDYRELYCSLKPLIIGFLIENEYNTLYI